MIELFVVSKTANGVSDATLRNYHYHRKAVSKYLDTNKPISEITKRDLERMIVDMKKDGIKHNSIATYVRFLRTIFNWCEAEEIAVPKLKNLKEKEVVKETYTDEELEKLLRKPKKGCDFGECFSCTASIKKGRPFGKPTKAVLQTDKIFPCFYAQLQRWKKTKKIIEN